MSKLIFTNNSNYIFLIIGLILIFILVISYLILRSIYVSFLLKNSKAINELKTINKQYIFRMIDNFNMVHRYDNENFYDTVSPEDYLIYQLQFIQKDVKKALEDTLYNKNLYPKYKESIDSKCIFGLYEVNKFFKKFVLYLEKKEFKKILQKPTTEFFIKVKIILTNIQDEYKSSKYSIFNADEVKDLIFKINRKSGHFFVIEDIWDAICRVERAKVSNKMRFSIYERDGYRCCKCHKKTNDLEIDHIIPIAKGGKTTYNNLQTLCHRCNVKKGSNLE